MDRLLSDNCLQILTEKYCFVDGSEIPFLIKALHSARDLQKDLQALPDEKALHLLVEAQKLDDAITAKIIELI
ncbi:MAG: hypothetical protein HWQ36_25875 [Nostoc sp. NMS2]|uniref:hypothetical protein n=1 Tax=Nostoc sp. NMS2 TaxID=2815389 RepID=UPI0026010D8B|nr:hypothetical protein [Nostoc sp. NMS2]MBN3993816.1 hypothetical protein [Nostoc sp. NMS2]